MTQFHQRATSRTEAPENAVYSTSIRQASRDPLCLHSRQNFTISAVLARAHACEVRSNCRPYAPSARACRVVVHGSSASTEARNPCASSLVNRMQSPCHALPSNAASRSLSARVGGQYQCSRKVTLKSGSWGTRFGTTAHLRPVRYLSAARSSAWIAHRSARTLRLARKAVTAADLARIESSFA